MGNPTEDTTQESIQEKTRRLRREWGMEDEQGNPIGNAAPYTPLTNTFKGINPFKSKKTPKIIGQNKEWDPINTGLKTLAENVESEIGYEPTYTSGYRTQAQQDALPVPGKARISLHTSGRALDQSIAGLSPDQIQKTLNYYNSHPATKASVHNGNHIHIEYRGEGDAKDPSTIDSINDQKIDLTNPQIIERVNRLRSEMGTPPLDLPKTQPTTSLKQRMLYKASRPAPTAEDYAGNVTRQVNNLNSQFQDTLQNEVGIVGNKPETLQDYERAQLIADGKLIPYRSDAQKLMDGLENLKVGRPILAPNKWETYKEKFKALPIDKQQEIIKDSSKNAEFFKQTTGLELPDAAQGYLNNLESERIQEELKPSNLYPAAFKHALETPMLPKSITGLPGKWVGGITDETGKLLNELGIENDVAGFGRGVQKTVDDTVSGLTTPLNVATLPLFATKLAPLASGYFGTQTAKGAYDSGKSLIKSAQTGDTEGVGRDLSGLLLNSLFTAGLGKNVYKDLKKIIPNKKTSFDPNVLPPINTQTAASAALDINQPTLNKTRDLRPQQNQSVVLGSGLGGLQKFFEKDPVRVAREAQLKEIEAHAQKTGKKLSEAMDEVIPEFDPNLYADVMIRQREMAKEGSKKGPIQKASDFYRDFKRKIIDFNAPIEDALWAAQKKNKFEILPKYDITPQIDRALRANTIAGQFVKDYGMEKVIREVPDLSKLDQYLISKQALRVGELGKETGRNALKDQALVEALKPEYEPYAKVVNDYSRKLLDYSVDAGLVSKELAASLKEKYPDYVPLNRVFDELERGGGYTGGKGQASLSKQTVVQKIEGSTREIENPIESLLGKTNEAFMQGEKNKAAKLLADYKDLPGFEGFIRELKEGEKGKHTFSYLDGGVKRTFETTPEIAAAAKALNVQQLSVLGKIVATPARLAKAGITGFYVPFILSNIAKDQGTAFINSSRTLKTSILNPKIFFNGLIQAVTHGKGYQELVRQGAGGTSFDIARNAAPLTIERIRAGKDLKSRIKYTVRHPSEILRTIENVISRSEEMTRLQQYHGTKQALLKEGRTLQDAEILATQAARENTANFSRRGEWGTPLNASLLFFNAAKEGSRAFIRSASRAPLKTAVKVAASIYLPISILTAWNLSDPKRREAYEDIQDFEKENNLILIPPNPIQDEKGKWNVYKIPLPPGTRRLGDPVRRLIEQYHGMDPLKFSEVASALMGSVSPIEPNLRSIASTVTPQAIKPLLENLTNTNFFTGQQIVPDKLLKASPENQFKENTSGTARKIGAALGISPLKVEAFVKGTVGGVGSQALNASDRLLAATGVISKDQIGGQSISEGVESRFEKSSGNKKMSEFYDRYRQFNQERENQKLDRDRKVDAFFKNAKLLSEDALDKQITEMAEKDPSLFKKIMERAEEQGKGIGPRERVLKSIPIKGGQRAQFLIKELDQIKDPEAKAQYIENLATKGLITDEVINHIVQLKTTGRIQNDEE